MLLEDRLDRAAPARLYHDPVSIIRCDDAAEIDAALAEIGRGAAADLHAAGFLSYELGYALEPRLAPLMPPVRDTPLLWFGLFEKPRLLSATILDRAFAEHGPPPPITQLTPGHDRDQHTAKVLRILDLIGAGDVYQVNLTFPIRFRYPGDPLALYGALRTGQPVAHGGLVAMGDRTVLSASPELFLEVTGGRATVRPMKGTAARGADADADRAATAALRFDPKQRAENLMIVDLIRNDLARVSARGGVRTPELFNIETFPTFHALTSTVTAQLRPGLDLRAILAALFPCGSIVGAPKIRAGEVIADLEAGPRGVYTGAIGAISPAGDIDFSVAIRTAVVGADGEGRYGVGGGIVADSDPDAEYDEALLKARLLAELATDYGLIETFRWSARGGFVRLSAHLDRLAASAGQLGFTFRRPEVLEALAQRHNSLSRGDGDRRIRLVLTRDGGLTIADAAVDARPDRTLRLGVAEDRLDAGDAYLRHKTTRRAVYERAFVQASGLGLDEAVLLNRDGAVADGSRNSVFAELGGRLVTPPLDDGALPGVLRATLIAEGRAVEGRLTLDTVRGATRWFVGNSLHGLRAARLIDGPAMGGAPE